MGRMLRATAAAIAVLAVAGALPGAVSLARADDGLHFLEGPQGGHVVYGPVPGHPGTPPEALGAVLRSLRDQFGDRPQVGRVFQVKGSDSAALYFTLVRRSTDGLPAGGMIVVARGPAGAMEAGVVSDRTDRLTTSFNPMVQTLMSAWHPQGVAAAPGGAGPAAPTTATAPRAATAPAATLHPYTLPDHTAAVGLPEGWQIRPGSGGGTIMAAGPNGEFASLGAALLAVDNSTPQGKRLQMQATQGNLRNTSYAQNLYYPYGQPLGHTFIDLTRMARQKQGLPPVDIRIASETPIPSAGPQRCTHLQGELESPDSHGPQSMDTVYCVTPPHAGLWMTLVYHITVPKPLADRERATLSAVLASYQADRAAIQRQAGQIAAPEIARIHEIGRQAAQQAAAADQRRIASRQSFEAHNDALDRRSQSFSNYLLDQTVVLDREHNAHGTVWNQTADALVRSDPNRFEYVDRPGYWKGIDY